MKFRFILSLLLCTYYSSMSQSSDLKNIDDLANSSVLLAQPTIKDSFDIGTGTIVRLKKKYFILTASHVIEKFDLRALVFLHLPKDKPLKLRLINLTRGNSIWQSHPIADLAVIQIYPNKDNEDSILINYSFSADQLATDSVLPRDMELTFFGYPVIDANLNHFSALSFHGTLASGLITVDRADIGTPCDFLFMNIPSMEGCSGSGVFFNLAKTIMIGGINKTWMIGIVHGTKGDKTGGKIAMITPLSYLLNWNINMK